MKKTLAFLLIISVMSTSATAQNNNPFKPKNAENQNSGITNIDKIVNGISKEVGGLSNEEEKGVKEATSDFLSEYKNLQPKQKTDPKGFLSDLDNSKKKFDRKMQLAMGAGKLTKFVGKSAGGAASKVLGMLM